MKINKKMLTNNQDKGNVMKTKISAVNSNYIRCFSSRITFDPIVYKTSCYKKELGNLLTTIIKEYGNFKVLTVESRNDLYEHLIDIYIE